MTDRPFLFLQEPSWDAIGSPGLVVPHEEMTVAAASLKRLYHTFLCKADLDCLLIGIIGGTGTGKSTIFNALARRAVSAVGVERPTTTCPVGFGHAGHPLERVFPVSLLPLRRIGPGPQQEAPPADCLERAFRYVEHHDDGNRHLLFMDAPDVDSLEEHNRLSAEIVYLLSHVVVFVTSQEKYADDVPSRYLERAVGDGKPLFILFNKIDEGQDPEEVRASFRDRGVPLERDRFFTLPFMKSTDRSPEAVASVLKDARDAIDALCSPATMERIRSNEQRRSTGELLDGTVSLLSKLARENAAAQAWIAGLDDLADRASGDLLRDMAAGYTEKNLASLKKSLTSIFSRYDLLAGPRKAVMSLMRIPFRLVGLGVEAGADNRKEELLKAGEAVDNSPILHAMRRLNLRILEDLSPPSKRASLFSKLRDETLPLTDEEIDSRIRQKQEELARWLDETIRRLSEDLPRGKKVGIYSTATLWGAAIISFQTVIGGGLALLELALDAVLAPFITKGSVELFIYRELRTISREMDRRYREGIGDIFHEQKERYTSALKDRLTPESVGAELMHLREALEQTP